MNDIKPNPPPLDPAELLCIVEAGWTAAQSYKAAADEAVSLEIERRRLLEEINQRLAEVRRRREAARVMVEAGKRAERRLDGLAGTRKELQHCLALLGSDLPDSRRRELESEADSLRGTIVESSTTCSNAGESDGK